MFRSHAIEMIATTVAAGGNIHEAGFSDYNFDRSYEKERIQLSIAVQI